ncbi:MAG: beta-lactamase family protein [Saprospiraceae bacterium]|nr:beta-lactamase family protein [Saprospiraceae bacterium]
MSRVLLYAFVFASVSSCTFENRESGIPGQEDCIGVEKSSERKVQLEQGIREQVKFLGEAEVLNSIMDRLSAYNIPALSLAVINEGKIDWSDTYQNANFTKISPLNCSSIFQAASLSKPVTFLAALRMQAAGRIDLDKNIQEYLKDFVIPQGKQTEENPVTFRNIFSHTSGINPGGYEGYSRNVVMPSDLDVLRGSAGVNSPAIEVIAPPNETLAYSGGGYTLAELALQDIFNEAFPDIMQKWILAPVGMDHSEFTQPLSALDSIRAAKGYTQSGAVIEGGWRNYPEQAAAGLWSTSVDLARFLIEIYEAYQGNSSILSQSQIRSILSDERDGHVYGFLLSRSEDDLTITHYGGNAGYRTGMTISLTSGNGLVYLINSDNGAALGNELFLSASQVYDWKQFRQTNVQRKQVEPAVLRELSGEYKWNNQINLSVTFDENNNVVSLHFPNGDEYKLVPITGEELDFIHPNTGVSVSFLKENNFQSFTLYGQRAVKLNTNVKMR